jgi:hypothetical protein
VAVECPARKIYGLQYHPEVTHSERGLDTLRHFLLTLCGCKPTWSMADVLAEQLQKIKDAVRARALRLVGESPSGRTRHTNQILSRDRHRV